MITEINSIEELELKKSHRNRKPIGVGAGAIIGHPIVIGFINKYDVTRYSVINSGPVYKGIKNEKLVQ